MPGMGMVTALVVSLIGAQPMWPDLGNQPPATGGGEKDAALVVAVSEYAFLPHVAGAASLGVAWYLYLGKVRNVPTVLFLKDGEATPNKIRNALDEVAKRVKPGGRAWVVFVGHGAPSEDGRDGALVSVTAQADQVDFFPHTVTQGEVLERLGKTAPGALPPILIVDACYSGTDYQGKTLVKGAQFAVSSALLVWEGATVLTAGRAKDIAGQLPGTEHPAFSYLLLGALRGWGDSNGDGIVTAREAVEYARDALLILDPGRQQKPQATGPDQPLTEPLLPEVSERGPDLMKIKLSVRSSAGEADVDRSSEATGPSARSVTGPEETALERRLSELERTREAREFAGNQETESEEAARKERVQRLDATWTRLKALVGSGVPEATEAVQAFLAECENDPLAEAYAREARQLLEWIGEQQQADVLGRMEQAAQMMTRIHSLLQLGNCAGARLVYETLVATVGTVEGMEILDVYIKQCEAWMK